MGGFYIFLIVKLSKGPVDEYYHKFTYQADGLIIGLSRADQGIVPSIITDSLSISDNSFRIVNFAMNGAFYGEIYLNAIKKKIKGNSKDGIFILSVNPSSFVASNGLNEEGIKRYDSRTILGRLSEVAANPNYDYLTCCYGAPLYNVFFNTTVWEHFVLHQDGWKEVVLQTPNSMITESDRRHWTDLNLRYYKQKLETEEMKEYRLKYFLKTISYLKQRGEVFLVRIPAAPKIKAFEDEQWAQFDKFIDSIAIKKNVTFLSYINDSDEFITYDGSHLHSESARLFSGKLALDIQHFRKKNKTLNQSLNPN